MPHKYELVVFWSAEDDAFVAEVPELAACMAHGATPAEALSTMRPSEVERLDGLSRSLARVPPLAITRWPVRAPLPSGHAFEDKDGYVRTRVRVLWSGEGATTYRSAPMMSPAEASALPDLPARRPPVDFATLPTGPSPQRAVRRRLPSLAWGQDADGVDVECLADRSTVTSCAAWSWVAGTSLPARARFGR